MAVGFLFMRLGNVECQLADEVLQFCMWGVLRIQWVAVPIGEVLLRFPLFIMLKNKRCEMFFFLT